MAEKGLRSVSPVLALIFVILFSHNMISATVYLVGHDLVMSFKDMEASFAPTVESGNFGRLYVADPIDACSNVSRRGEISNSDSFLLIERGGCSFEEKVRAAQMAGYQSAIVYDIYDEMLIAMAGNSEGIRINAVFVSKQSSKILKQYAGSNNYKVLITPSLQNSALSVMAISIVSLLAMSASMATCFFVRRRVIRTRRANSFRVNEFQRLSNCCVKAIPSFTFTSVHEDNCSSLVCVICLEDYCVGEKLRILPCRHEFHAVCVDSWLTKWRTFCPICKRDAGIYTADPPALESTPLLS